LLGINYALNAGDISPSCYELLRVISDHSLFNAYTTTCRILLSQFTITVHQQYCNLVFPAGLQKLLTAQKIMSTNTCHNLS